MGRVKQYSKGNHARKVKQTLNEKAKKNGGTTKGIGNLASKYGVPGGIRTHDPLLRRQPLYPLSYRDAALLKFSTRYIRSQNPGRAWMNACPKAGGT